MIETSDWIIFALVVAARFLVPLIIPFYPLPGILIALLLDGVDQTIFQVFTNLPLDGYQSYDKALDIYYLTVAYISTFRNWVNVDAFQVSRFLFYYRLVGVVLFEITHWRPLLIFFPNTFEYFFIWYEAVRLWWDPRKLPRTFLVSAAVGIWLIIKLPQEYWIHIVQMDATDFIKENLLGASLDTPWTVAIADNWLVILITLAVIGVALWLIISWLRNALPKPDHGIIFSADKSVARPTEGQMKNARLEWQRQIFDRDLFEKFIMIGLLTIIFAHVLPNATTSSLTILFQVGIFVTINTIVSHILARRGTSLLSGLVHFLVVLALNAAITLALVLLPGGETNWINAIVFILLLSLLVTLYDRFQPVHLARFPRGVPLVMDVTK
jgi:hypothetical protein